jgi:hypothetical protein
VLERVEPLSRDRALRWRAREHALHRNENKILSSTRITV